MHHRRRTSILLSAATCALTWRAAHGATSGTWTGQGFSWTASNAWTSSPAAYPDGGGTASFGNVVGYINVSANTNVTLNEMIIDTPLPYTFGGSITLAGPGEIDVEDSPAESPHFLSTSDLVNPGINGTAGLVKSGPGVLNLSSISWGYSGGTTVNGGTLEFMGLGAGSVTLNNGALRLEQGWGYNFNREVHLVNVGTFDAWQGVATFSGAITGDSIAFTSTIPLSQTSPGTTVTISGTNTYTGSTQVLAGNVTINGSGSSAETSGISIGGLGAELKVDNGGTAMNSRLGVATMSLSSSGEFYLRGNSATATSEHIGTISISTGRSVLDVESNGANVLLDSADLLRDHRGTVSLQFTGSTPSAASIQMNHVPTMVGGGGAAGSHDMSIIPWVSAGVGSVSGILSAGLVTDDNGFIRRLSDSTEYDTTIAPGMSSDNVELSSATALSSAATINALSLNGTTLSGAGTLTVTSGAIVSSTFSNRGTISANLDFGPNEGILLGNSLYISGKISGSNGITIASNGTFINGANDYTGTTTVEGKLLLTGDVASGSGVLGTDTSAVEQQGNGQIMYVGAATCNFNRDLHVTGNGDAKPLLGTTGSGVGMNVNGNITLDHSLYLASNTLNTTTTNFSMNLNGNISGTAGLLEYNPGVTVTLNGNNSYSGGTEIANDHWVANTNTAFGTGPIWLTTTTSTFSVGPNVNELDNPIVFINGDLLPFPSAMTLNGKITMDTSLNISTQSGSLCLNGTIEGGDQSAYLGLSAPGGITLSGANTFVDNVNDISSTLIATNDAAFGSPGHYIDVQSGTLQLQGGRTIQGQTVRLTNSTLLNTSDNNTWTGAIQCTGATFEVDGGTLNLNGYVENSFTKTGSGLLNVGTLSGGTVTVNAGTIRLNSRSGAFSASKISGLNFASTNGNYSGTVDMNNDPLLVDYTSGNDPSVAVRAEIIAGRAGGSWTGTGITSSVATAIDADPSRPFKTGVGYATAASLGIVGSGNVDQQHVDDTTVVIAYTLLGDSNLDGTVDSNDFALLAANIGKTGQQWVNGDYNYDGTVNALDFNALATNYGQSISSVESAAVGAQALGAVVPEPMLALPLIGLWSLRLRRKRSL